MARRGKVIPFPKAPPPPKGAQGSVEGRGAEDPGGRWIEVRRCRDQGEALVVKSLLESEDIPCLFRSRLAHSVHPFTVGDQGEVVVLVPAADAAQARILLARMSSGPSAP